MKSKIFFLHQNNNKYLFCKFILFLVSILLIINIKFLLVKAMEKSSEPLETIELTTFLDKSELKNFPNLKPFLANQNVDETEISTLSDNNKAEMEISLLSHDKSLPNQFFLLSCKHDLGSFFSKRMRLFYALKNVRTVPCASFFEWFNFKQILFGTFDANLSKINCLFKCLNLSGIKEEFIDDKYEKVSLVALDFYRLLKKNPNLGYFYLSSQDLDKAISVNISFCNCQVKGYSVLELIHEIINLRDENFDVDNFRKHLVIYIKHLMEISDSDEESMKVSVNNLLEKIHELSDIDELDRNLLFNVLLSFSRVFIPSLFEVNYSINTQRIKPLYEMNLDITNDAGHKTLGFLFKLEKNEQLSDFYLNFYEIFQDENNIEQIKPIDHLLILRTDKKQQIFYNSFFHHLNINVLYKKTLSIHKKAFFNARLA
ncbi:hypothetical protein [Candidatus Phytoplasma citri]|uniref:Uncharacterized protein n=1 Tax=Candidatus Phytoplasma citri TaxID=180978 RepID=A0A1S9M0G5_9MOLU|nr:hypothetical protein [Candidatus Phytoplasma aurantifolia]MDO8060025.1 hypothetical protein [Candidatus Phytoplasma aurantifolia]MDO8078966.1 hypothetical protein [Candidatus Phytoplasma aurantifolia]OOP58599.1 hypothetical protein B2G44_01605 [Candidatus Phytoplasma aurantifolia]